MVNNYVSDTGISSTDVEENHLAGYHAATTALVLSLADETKVYPSNGGVFFENFAQSRGQNHSVIGENTDQTFSTDHYYADGTGDDIVAMSFPFDHFSSTMAGGYLGLFNVGDQGVASGTYTYKVIARTYAAVSGTDADTGWTNPSNAFDGDSWTAATIAGATGDESLGKTFGAKTVNTVKVKVGVKNSTASGSLQANIIIQTYNGSTWDSQATIAGISGSSDEHIITRSVDIDASVEGVRVLFDKVVGGTTAIDYTIYRIDESDGTDEDTGFVNAEEMINFSSAFTLEPDELQVKTSTDDAALKGVLFLGDKP